MARRPCESTAYADFLFSSHTPTVIGYLAPLVVRELARVIRLLRDEGVTILLVEQNMKLAEAVADELHIMVKGRMVYSATPAVFRAEEETIRARFLTV